LKDQPPGAVKRGAPLQRGASAGFGASACLTGSDGCGVSGRLGAFHRLEPRLQRFEPGAHIANFGGKRGGIPVRISSSRGENGPPASIVAARKAHPRQVFASISEGPDLRFGR
jgi:hypothetical protein